MTAKRMLKPALLIAAMATVAGASSRTFDGDRAIERSFAALFPTVTVPVRGSGLVAGSEDFWLRQSVSSGTPGLEHVVWRGPVAAGGTLVIGSGSARKELEVISVDDSAATKIDMGITASLPLRVQARDGQDVTAPAM